MANLRWDIRSIYLYMVCLITLVIFIFAVSNLAGNLVELVYPRPYYQDPYSKPGVEETSAADKAKMMEYQQEQDRYYAVKGGIESGILVLVSVPVYLYHWRRIEKGSIDPKESDV